MTIASETSRVNLVGDGENDTFTFTFEIYVKTDLLVYVAGELQAVDVNYTIADEAIENPDGGDIVFGADYIPALAAVVSIILNLPITQLIDYVEADKFPAETHERGLDRLVKIAQRFKEQLSRTPSLIISSALSALTIPEAASRVIGWDALAEELTTYPITPVLDANWDSIQNYDNDLATAVATIGAGAKTLLIDVSTESVTSNLEVPETLELYPMRTGLITVDNCILTINRLSKAVGSHKIFNCINGGTIVFGDGATKEIDPEWWTTNAVPKTTNMTTAAQAAITAAIPNNIPVNISSMMLLTASVNIDRQVDGAAYDEYFEIISHNGGGFYVSSAIDMFSSTIAFTTAPVSQLVKFKDVYFESSSSALAAYVLDDSRFLRTQFHGCSFSKIKCLTASIYTQSLYFFHCNMRRWAGIFYNSPVISFDIKFHGCLAEAGVDFAVVHAAVGTSFIGTTIEGMSGTAIEYNEAQGLTISGGYFELNDKDIEDVAGGGVSSWGVAILGNMFSHTPAGAYAPSSDYSVIWALGDGNVSKGNYFSYKGHYLLTTSQVEINDHAVTELANRYPNPAFLVRPTADQDDIAHTTDVTVIFGTEVFDKGACFAANTFTAPVTGKYQFSVNLELHEVDSDATYYSLILTTSNRNYAHGFSGSMLAADGAYGNIGLSVLADMDATDTAHIVLRQEAGTQQTDIGTDSYFSGHFVGF